MLTEAKKSQPLPFLALLLAWLLPGAGHVYIGRTRRGIIILVTIAATFWAGIAMGGVMTVDPVNERWWFIGDMLTGVHGLVSWHRYQKVAERLSEDPAIGLPERPGSKEADRRKLSIDKKLEAEGIALKSPTETVARAYCGVAGLLNLMCIFDAVMLSLLACPGESTVRTDRQGKGAKSA